TGGVPVRERRLGGAPDRIHQQAVVHDPQLGGATVVEDHILVAVHDRESVRRLLIDAPQHVQPTGPGLFGTASLAAPVDQWDDEASHDEADDPGDDREEDPQTDLHDPDPTV